MRYSSGVRFSRAKPTGSFRVVQSGTRRVASHDETLQGARKSAAYWTSAVSSQMEIQERFPSGAWVTVETVEPSRPRAAAAASSKGKRSHATVKSDDTPSSTEGQPSKEKLQQAAKWIRRELTKRDDGSHPSHLASKVLEEADEKFKLGSYGVEGWAKSSRLGYQYLNYGDPYDSTIVVRSNPTSATVIVALGGWASYAGHA